jgi:hypothetical protein
VRCESEWWSSQASACRHPAKGSTAWRGRCSRRCRRVRVSVRCSRSAASAAIWSSCSGTMVRDCACSPSAWIEAGSSGENDDVPPLNFYDSYPSPSAVVGPWPSLYRSQLCGSNGFARQRFSQRPCRDNLGRQSAYHRTLLLAKPASRLFHRLFQRRYGRLPDQARRRRPARSKTALRPDRW